MNTKLLTTAGLLYGLLLLAACQAPSAPLPLVWSAEQARLVEADVAGAVLAVQPPGPPAARAGCTRTYPSPPDCFYECLIWAECYGADFGDCLDGWCRMRGTEPLVEGITLLTLR